MPTRTVRGHASRGQDHVALPRPDEIYTSLLRALRRQQHGRVQELRAALARLGYHVEHIPGTGGVRLVPPQREIRADILPLPRPPRMPVAWFARLDRALVDGDRQLEQMAKEELASLGYIVTTDRPGRRDR